MENSSLADARTAGALKGRKAAMSMVERVAKAIEAEIAQPKYTTLDTVPSKDAARVATMGLARAAIAAMREPAAPDLLEALKAMHTAFNAKKPIPTEEGNALEAMCVAAIAKAEGR